MAHLALSDIAGGQFLHTERLNRAGPGLAGADFKQARIWNGNWKAQWTFDPAIAGGSTQTLQAIADRFSFDLSLKAEKPPVINGENGVSQKAEGAGKASHYISFTRLATTGTIILDGKKFSVEGSSWMDHEFFSHQTGCRPDRLGLAQPATERWVRVDAVLSAPQRRNRGSVFGRNLRGFPRTRPTSGCR